MFYDFGELVVRGHVGVLYQVEVGVWSSELLSILFPQPGRV